MDNIVLQTLFYIDPPYPLSTRNVARGNAVYAHDLTDDEHRELSHALRKVQGTVVLSGYHCELYDKELYSDWYSAERISMADGARERTEVLWMNQRLERQEELEFTEA